MTPDTAPDTRPLTGRHVFWCFFAFFTVVVTVNLTMATLASSTFGGVDVPSAYRAGLKFNSDIASAQAQDNRHWQVEITPSYSQGTATVLITVRDQNLAPLTGLDAVARLRHPSDSRHDQSIELKETTTGQYFGTSPLTQGHYDLTIELGRGEQMMFRSKSRIAMR